ncbi:HAD-IC family P-type ATPase [Lentzea flava]|uniref:Haloacid dehalogenase n=1 Tax=Lentzea flava TaxID=103732 RepID=A0ABQ2UCU7_9PSEU|nr:HAD-IC family P-type ATPase [Lentzea flava]GGU18440.1 haloacid dehalogenase [Lentzea flava]
MLRDLVGLRRRQVWARQGRLHVEVHGLDTPHALRLIKAVEQRLESLDGVLWARVNAPAQRVVVAVDSPGPRRDELIRIIERAERHAAEHGDEEACEELHHPCEGPRTRQTVSALAADAVGLGLSAVTRLTQWVPLPTEFAALGSILQHHPKLKALTGKEAADSLLPHLSALAQGLAAGGEGILLDGAERIAQIREARAYRQAWNAAEPELVAGPEHAAGEPVLQPRPVALPQDPVDRYAERAMGVGALAAAAAVPFFGPRRALALGLASTPKAPAAAREGFATYLGRILAKRGVIVMDRGVLRRLGQIDTVVLDERALRTGHTELTDVVPMAGADPREIAAVAFELFDPQAPDQVREADGWRLGPLEGTRGKQGAERLRKRGADDVLGLWKRQRLLAVVGVSAQHAHGVQAIAAAARRAGARVVLAADGPNGKFSFVDEVVPGGADLARSVRSVQERGGVVLLLSGDRRALGAADCGLGAFRTGEPPAWGAHVLVGQDFEAAALVIDAVGVASRVDSDGIKLAAGGSGVGAVAAVQTPGPRAASRGLFAGNAAAAIGFALGHWRAHQLLSRPISPPVSTTPWHLMPVDVVLERLQADVEGLTGKEVQRRARASGTGQEPLGLSLWQAFVEELANPLTPVLALGAALAAAVGSPMDAGLVAAITGASALVGSVQRVQTDRALADLFRLSAVGACVRRDGAEVTVAAGDLVPGDVVVLRSSDVVPADCRILEATALEADESSLTGESLPVAKDSAPVVAADISARSSMLYEGTTIATGNAIAVVVATGMATEAGRSMATARQHTPAGGVESRLESLTRTAMPLALGAAAAVTGSGLLRGIPPQQTLSAAVNLAVASVPEGLPFLVNAAQLGAARRLADHGALVRNPRTIEALGRVDVLCFDKTGTLTEGSLSLAKVGTADRLAQVSSLDGPLRDVLAAALRATPAARSREELEHQTDRAVTSGARKARVGVRTGARAWRRKADLPFEPSRGYHATTGSIGKRTLLSVKGAPEIVLARCALDEDSRAAVKDRMEQLAGSGHRVLAVAERVADSIEASDDAVRDLQFRGFVALADPVRDSAAPAAEQLAAAGVKVVMITGDHPATADAIASTVHQGENQRVITGSELDELDDDKLADALSEVDVIARCSPTHKVRIIQAYQRVGRTVAMTGDGANDAPAIRLADVGIALGRRGTPAARSAADLVVTDDRLETITAAVLEGRAMWSSVREALAILLGGNLGEIGFNVLAALITGRSPLNARQILLVNLLTDLAPALAIALRPPKPDQMESLLHEGPETSLGGQLDRDILLRALTTTFGASTAWAIARLTGRSRRASTVALAALVGTQLGQTLVTGGMDRRVLGASLGSAAALAAVIQTPGVSGFFGCTPLGPIGWSIAAGATTTATALNAVLSKVLRV